MLVLAAYLSILARRYAILSRLYIAMSSNRDARSSCFKSQPDLYLVYTLNKIYGHFVRLLHVGYTLVKSKGIGFQDCNCYSFLSIDVNNHALSTHWTYITGYHEGIKDSIRMAPTEK